MQLIKHPETRGGINEKTISIRVSGFILTYGDRVHRKFFSSTTYALHIEKEKQKLIHIKEKSPLIHAPDSTIILV